MAKIAIEGSKITQSTAPNHINYTKYEQTGTSPTYPCGTEEFPQTCGGNPIYGNVPYKASATVNGSCKSTVTNVKIEGKAPIVNGDKTTESDTYSISGTYVSGSHSNGVGSVTSGNSRNVFINSKSVSIKGSTINTHAGTSATITDVVSSTVNIGA